MLCENSFFRIQDGLDADESSATCCSNLKRLERRAVMAGFDGGDITSNAGALLLGQGWIVALD